MIPPAEISAVVLAGGCGRRMGGAEKGLTEFRGRPLIAHVADIIRPQAGPFFISANRHLETYAASGARVVPDRWPDLRGPLAGIASVWTEVTTPYLLVAPCDMPFLPQDMASRLAEALLSGGGAAVVRSAGWVQPLCALMHRNLAAELGRYVEAGGTRATQWWVESHAAQVEFAEAEAFVNINTPEEKIKAEVRAGQRLTPL